ncbi:MAG: carboxypeptidase regulatory-like domain-containing protein [Elusimicrobia bacterium]|nr:carboxypeptidase regulatory-like domain-containing protein [Elusimicrobiota bacterium]
MKSNSSGLTLVEVMIAGVILSVIGLLAAKIMLGQANLLLITKARGVAESAGGDRLRKLKAMPYQVLIPSDAPVAIPGVTNGFHDPITYPPEVVGGQHNLTVYALVERVRQEKGEYVPVAPAVPDTRVKRITITSVWNEKGVLKHAKMSSISNLLDLSANVAFFGTVRDTFMQPIPGAIVELVEDSSRYGSANFVGDYRFFVFPGTYTLRATGRGYFEELITGQSVTALGAQQRQVDFVLSPRSFGEIQGAVWVNDHPVISRVAGAIPDAGFDQEFVELFNPSTFTWNAASLVLAFGRQQCNGVNGPWCDVEASTISIQFVNTDIPPRSFFLFANVGTVHVGAGAKAADAVWRADPNNLDAFGALHRKNNAAFTAVNLNVIPVWEDDNEIGPAAGERSGEGAGGLRLLLGNVVLDEVGWSGGKHNAVGKPPVVFRGSPSAELLNKGLVKNSALARIAGTLGYDDTLAPCYDSGINQADWQNINGSDRRPRNSGDQLPVGSVRAGRPAVGVPVMVDDGLSISTVSWANFSGIRRIASFGLLDVATGSWRARAVQGDREGGAAASVVANGVTVLDLHLDSPATAGVVSGRVTDSLTGVALGGITVLPRDGISSPAVTDGAGYYLFVTPSVNQVNITVNPTPGDGLRGEGEVLVLVPSPSVFLAGVDVRLSPMVRLKGRLEKTTSIGPPLKTYGVPNVPILLTNVSNKRVNPQEVWTDSSGNFEAFVATGVWNILAHWYDTRSLKKQSNAHNFVKGKTVTVDGLAPIVDAGGIQAPGFGFLTYTVTGTVRRNGNPVVTGVTLVAGEENWNIGAMGTPQAPPDLPTDFFSVDPMTRQMTMSDANGRYRFQISCGPGKHIIHAYLFQSDVNPPFLYAASAPVSDDTPGTFHVDIDIP